MRIIQRCRFGFRTIVPEDYLFNQREALCAQTVRTTELKPLPLANQGDIDLIDEVRLIGVPKHETPQSMISINDEVHKMTATGTDLIFLQIDPS